VVSVSALNDRAIITEGKASPPLVFSGGLDPSGADWATPIAVLLTRDSGVTWIDISDSVLDSDADSTLDIGGLTPEDGSILVCLDTRIATGLFLDLTTPGPTSNPIIVESLGEDWGPSLNNSDDTNGLTRSGVIAWQSDQEPPQPRIINNIEGYWLRIRCANLTDPRIRLNRILFRAPCQPLSRMGNGVPDTPLGFIYWDESAKSAKDFTIEVQDFNYPTFARLNDGALETPEAMAPEDYLYVGCVSKFRDLEITPHNDYHNSNPAVLNGSYWNGTSWAPVSGLSDGTAEPAGAPFGKRGLISWNVPDDWVPNRPLGSLYPYGYWIRLSVSAALTPKTFISEAAIWPKFDPLKKYGFVITVRDRVILLNRSDSPDRIDISRPLEEYGVCGPDSSSLRIGGAGEITAAIEVFNQGFIAKTDDWYLLNGYSPSTFSLERAETAGQAPINSRVLVAAPHMEADSKNLMGLYYINQRGAWHFAGLKVYRISDQVSWWDQTSSQERLDLNNLGSAFGMYWAARNRIIWAVPMIGASSEQKFNNRLIVYDLGLKAWLPPFAMSVSSLSTFSDPGSDHNPGQVRLLAGDYRGRILELFSAHSLSDAGAPVSGWAETPWVHFGTPHVEKIIRALTLFAKTTAFAPIRVEVFTDGNMDSPRSIEFTRPSAAGVNEFTIDPRPFDLNGRFFKFRISLTAPSTLFGLQATMLGVREWGAI
jgi:hypothetical protein